MKILRVFIAFCFTLACSTNFGQTMPTPDQTKIHEFSTGVKEKIVSFYSPIMKLKDLALKVEKERGAKFSEQAWKEMAGYEDLMVQASIKNGQVVLSAGGVEVNFNKMGYDDTGAYRLEVNGKPVNVRLNDPEVGLPNMSMKSKDTISSLFVSKAFAEVSWWDAITYSAEGAAVGYAARALRIGKWLLRLGAAVLFIKTFPITSLVIIAGVAAGAAYVYLRKYCADLVVVSARCASNAAFSEEEKTSMRSHFNDGVFMTKLAAIGVTPSLETCGQAKGLFEQCRQKIDGTGTGPTQQRDGT